MTLRPPRLRPRPRSSSLPLLPGALLLAGLLLPAPSPAGIPLAGISLSGVVGPGHLQAQGTGGTSGSASNPAGWYLDGGGSMSMERSPLGTRWRDASQAVALRLDLPAIRGFRPTFEGGRASHRDRDCFNEPVCSKVQGWSLRAGVATGDILPRDNFLLAPYLRGDVGVFLGPEASGFSPSLRVGLLVRATPRIVPRIEAGQVRYPVVGSVWELGGGVRITLH